MMKDFVDVVFKAQVAFYLKNGIKPIDVYLGRNETIVFRFDKKESSQYYIQWMKNRTKKEEDKCTDDNQLRKEWLKL